MLRRDSVTSSKSEAGTNVKESLLNLHEILSSSKLTDSLLSKTLLIEYKYLQKFCPSGVYVIPQFDDIKIWHGVLFVRDGIYKDGIFKFEINVPSDYPNKPPKVIFTTKVVHPLIDENTSELDLNSKFDSWEIGKCFIIKIIYFIQDIFYNPNLSDEKIKDKTKFEEEALNTTKESFENRYDNANSKSSIKFSQFNRYHQLILDKILKQNKDVNTYDRIEDFKNWFMNNFMEIIQNNENKKN